MTQSKLSWQKKLQIRIGINKYFFTILRTFSIHNLDSLLFKSKTFIVIVQSIKSTSQWNPWNRSNQSIWRSLLHIKKTRLKGIKFTFRSFLRNRSKLAKMISSKSSLTQSTFSQSKLGTYLVSASSSVTIISTWEVFQYFRSIQEIQSFHSKGHSSFTMNLNSSLTSRPGCMFLQLQWTTSTTV